MRAVQRAVPGPQLAIRSYDPNPVFIYRGAGGIHRDYDEVGRCFGWIDVLTAIGGQDSELSPDGSHLRCWEVLRVLDLAQRSNNGYGSVAEISVHHGRLFIGLSLLQPGGFFGRHRCFWRFGLDQSGKGDLAMFRKNLRRWSSLDNVVIHQGDSTQLKAAELLDLARGDIRLFSVDGGHTCSIVFSDMNLAEATIAPSGIVIADDVLNQDWPGVSTGTLRYMESGGKLVPFAIGFNKVFFANRTTHAGFRAGRGSLPVATRRPGASTTGCKSGVVIRRDAGGSSRLLRCVAGITDYAFVHAGQGPMCL